ncbi:hypothetical protein TNCV_2828331 [Trichonephila clavipes]|nr:hypothetical protein TNCV_2828331 [Trichonephila clavipes]
MKPAGWRGWFAAPKVAGSTEAQVGGFSWCRKSTAAMSYDYMASKRSLECLFDLKALAKIKFLSTTSHRQSSGASLWGGNWASKFLAVTGIAYMVPR